MKEGSEISSYKWIQLRLKSILYSIILINCRVTNFVQSAFPVEFLRETSSPGYGDDWYGHDYCLLN